jgi:4-diphosphocytidyl-2-C-methyl-D-erythritol kinase
MYRTGSICSGRRRAFSVTDFPLSAPLRLFAPAKINLSLEVCGRRPDGYHDVVTLMETVSLFDIIDIRPADRLAFVSDDRIPPEDDLVWRALKLIRESVGSELCVDVHVKKGIPIAAGLGGGSSDAGTLIAALGHLIKMPPQVMHDIASSLGSDVPFFLRGGMALATGTGTELEPIEPSSRRWYVIVVPAVEIEHKTATLYQSLTESDLSDGSRTREIADRIARTQGYAPVQPVNAFQRVLLSYPAFKEAADALEVASGRPALASGAGPSVFTIAESYEDARSIYSRLLLPEAKTFIATSLGPALNDARATHLSS